MTALACLTLVKPASRKISPPVSPEQSEAGFITRCCYVEAGRLKIGGRTADTVGFADLCASETILIRHKLTLVVSRDALVSIKVTALIQCLDNEDGIFHGEAGCTVCSSPFTHTLKEPVKEASILHHIF